MRTLYVVDLGKAMNFYDFEQVYYIKTIGSALDAEMVLVRASEVPDGIDSVYVSRRGAQEDLGCWRAPSRAR